MNPLALAKLIGSLALGAVLLFGFTTVKGWRDDAIRLDAENTKLKNEAKVSGLVADAIAEAFADQTRQETTVADRRASAEQSFEEMRRADPTVDDWASQPIPVRLRDDDRARRLALDGSEVDPLGSEASH